MIRRMPLPEARGGEVRSAFMRGLKERPLRLVVDHSRIAPGQASELLAGFVGHPSVELWSTHDDAWPHLQIDWASSRDDRLRVHWTSSTRRSLTGVWPVSQYRQAAHQAVTLGPVKDEEMAYREFILAAACADSRVDALVTDSALLLGRPPGVRGNPVPPVVALASLGLFLRLRGDFHVSRDLRLDRGMFYGLAAWELVPQAWRYVNACRSAGQAIGRDTFWMLGRAVVERMERALRARDRLHEQFQVPQSHDTADEALFYLDMLLVPSSAAPSTRSPGSLTSGSASTEGIARPVGGTQAGAPSSPARRRHSPRSWPTRPRSGMRWSWSRCCATVFTVSRSLRSHAE